MGYRARQDPQANIQFWQDDTGFEMSSNNIPSILEEIVARRISSYPVRFSEEHVEELKSKAKSAEKPRPFFETLTASSDWSLIAEIKFRSPSKGQLMPDSNPLPWAQRYERDGAGAISIVTEAHYFGGTPHWIPQVKAASKLPVLRKDFFTTSEDILESRAFGADAVLLIAAILDEKELNALVNETFRLGMEPLIEVHDENEAKRAMKTKARMIGINNRNLHDFSVDIQTTKKLMPILEGRHVVSESGIFSSKEVKELAAAGVKTFLVGEAILTAANPDQKIAELLGRVCLS